MLDFIFGGVMAVVIYLVYLFVIILNKKRLKKFITKGTETIMIKNKYNLDYSKISHKLVANIIAITNALIMCSTYIIVSYIPHLILKLVVSLPVAVILLVIAYVNIGKYLKKRCNK